VACLALVLLGLGLGAGGPAAAGTVTIRDLDPFHDPDWVWDGCQVEVEITVGANEMLWGSRWSR